MHVLRQVLPVGPKLAPRHFPVAVVIETHSKFRVADGELNRPLQLKTFNAHGDKSIAGDMCVRARSCEHQHAREQAAQRIHVRDSRKAAILTSCRQ